LKEQHKHLVQRVALGGGGGGGGFNPKKKEMFLGGAEKKDAYAGRGNTAKIGWQGREERERRLAEWWVDFVLRLPQDQGKKTTYEGENKSVLSIDHNKHL